MERKQTHELAKNKMCEKDLRKIFVGERKGERDLHWQDFLERKKNESV